MNDYVKSLLIIIVGFPIVTVWGEEYDVFDTGTGEYSYVESDTVISEDIEIFNPETGQYLIIEGNEGEE